MNHATFAFLNFYPNIYKGGGRFFKTDIMRNYIRTLIIGFLFLTSCSTFQNKPLTFISPASIVFNNSEITQPDKLKRNDSIVYNDLDSFIIMADYNHIKLTIRPFYKKKIHEYYFINTNEQLIDYVTLDYFEGKLATVILITKNKSRIDSLSSLLERFFLKDFKNNNYNQNKTRQLSYFSKGNLFVDRTIYLENYEAEFSIQNKKVKIPSWCGTKTPWWYYLKFWRW